MAVIVGQFWQLVPQILVKAQLLLFGLGKLGACSHLFGH